jgi:hypothetical protein
VSLEEDTHGIVDRATSVGQNGSGNPAAVFDGDVGNYAIGGVGSPLGSAFGDSPDVLAIGHEPNALLESSSVKKSV